MFKKSLWKKNADQCHWPSSSSFQNIAVCIPALWHFGPFAKLVFGWRAVFVFLVKPIQASRSPSAALNKRPVNLAKNMAGRLMVVSITTHKHLFFPIVFSLPLSVEFIAALTKSKIGGDLRSETAVAKRMRPLLEARNSHRHEKGISWTAVWCRPYKSFLLVPLLNNHFVWLAKKLARTSLSHWRKKKRSCLFSSQGL